MQNNAIDVITRGVDIYELILQSQRLQNGRQTHIGNTSLFCKDKTEKSTNGWQTHIGNTMIVTSKEQFLATSNNVLDQ